MPCYHPLQAVFFNRSDGKKNIYFSNSNARAFVEGRKPLGDNNIALPCGRCMGCRLEKSRQWATRCMHEAQLYDLNCFITLTYNDDNLPKDGSLNKKHIQDFIKRFRRKFEDIKIRFFYCGEYGEKLGRPHYHVCVFNYDFKDKQFWKTVRGSDYYVSGCLSDLWKFGFSVIGDLNFESAAYVARYCTKKVSGDMAKSHYGDKMPEFAQMSLKPGIGKAWLDKYGKTDVFPHDVVYSRGVKCKPPRYYDKVLEKVNPGLLEKNKVVRRQRSESKDYDNTFQRLLAKERCQEAKFKQLIRSMEIGI